MKKNYFLLLTLCMILSTASVAQTYNFTTAGATGRFGPTQPQIDAAYAATTLAGAVIINTQGIQEWVVPATASYSIEVSGAGTTNGTGANLSGEFSLTAGQTLYIAVGQNGAPLVCAGNGGSFVGAGASLIASTPLIVGGGGAGYTAFVSPLSDAPFTNDGNQGNVGFGGTAGNGGQTNTNNTPYGGGGGGGFFSNGVNTSNYGDVGRGFQQGAIGGDMSINSATSDGGFGGGGSGYPNDEPGGGGGYSGGGGGGAINNSNTGIGADRLGGAGGSFNGGTNVNNIGPNIGEGAVTIIMLCDALTTTVSSSSVCLSEMVTLTASSINSGTISWDNGITDGVAFTPALGTTTYTATSSNGNDCSFSVDITANPLPTVDAGADISICNNGSIVTLTATGTGDTYSWDNGVTDGVAFVPSAGTTTYTVTATNTASGCSSTDMVDVTVSSSMIIVGSTQDEFTGGDGYINIQVTGGILPLTYSWDNGLGNVEDPSALSAGIYTVTVTDSLGCTATATYAIYSQVGISELETELLVYPNPVIHELNIILNGQFDYEVSNLVGQVLFSAKGNNEAPVDFENLPKGTYFLNVKQDDQSKIVKIIKQ